MKEEILIQITVREAVMLRDLIWRNRRSFRKLKGLMARLEDRIIEKVEPPPVLTPYRRGGRRG